MLVGVVGVTPPVAVSPMIAPLIPGGAGLREQRPAVRRRGGGGRARRPLPLVEVATSRTGSAVYGVTALDCHGRIADRVVLRALGWAPGTRLEITGARDVVTVRASGQGASRVTPQGHVRLAAEVRHCCGVRTGDRVLLIADPHAGVLRVVPPAVLDNLVSDALSADVVDAATEATAARGGATR